MTKDFSYSFKGRQSIKGKTFQFCNAGFLTKKVGLIIVGIMICGFCGSIFMGKMIQSGLNDLANKKETKQKMITMKRELLMERDELLAENNIEKAVSILGLYPVKPSQIIKRF